MEKEEVKEEKKRKGNVRFPESRSAGVKGIARERGYPNARAVYRARSRFPLT